MAAIGILGGTFNPPHIGHLVMAQEARWALQLERVVLMPVAAPPHKDAPDDPGADLRVALCRLAVGEEPALAVSTLEVDRGGESYTVDTLRALHDRAPEHALTFIVGGDMAHSLPTWREPKEVLRLARLAVAERDGMPRQHLADRLASLHEGASVVFFDMPRLDVSSSAIRRRVAERRPIRHLVPDAVEAEIRARDLYRSRAGRPAA